MRILVMEEDPALQENLRQNFVATGFRVYAAQDGEDALWAGLTYPVDAAIVGMSPEKRTGIELIREWRAQGRTFPIVMLTSPHSWRDRIEGLSAGADDYVSKPLCFEEVLMRVNRLIRARYRSASCDGSEGSGVVSAGPA